MEKIQTNFTINGEKHQVAAENSLTSLTNYIRNTAHLKGTKWMCREGSCGACVVTVTKHDPISGTLKTRTVNSCLVQVYQCNGWNITTIEGMGDKVKGYHLIQKRIHEYNATQCGYCTPGIVMNMYGVLAENPRPSKRHIEDSLDGNICRCTGYRPILDAMKSMAKDVHSPIPVDIEDLAKNICQASTVKDDGITDIVENSITPNVYRPKDLKQLYSLLARLNHTRYKLISGNTGVAIYKTVKKFDAFIDISSISELYQYSVVAKCPITLGSNISIRDAEILLRQVATKDRRFLYCVEIADHLLEVANIHVRNMGSWAGNLMLKHTYRDFSSDIFMLFEAVGAVLTIRHFSGTVEEVPLDVFLNIDMHGKVIEKVTLPLLLSINFVFKTFKVKPRMQNAPSYLSAAFLFDVDKERNFMITKKPVIVYQGVGDSFLHPKNTEQYLIGKELGDRQILQQSLKIIKEEVRPEPSVSTASTQYRRLLAQTIYYRFILQLMGDSVNKRVLSGAIQLERPISSGKQQMSTNQARWPLTKPISKIESINQCAGKIQFTGDIPIIAKQVYAAFIISEVGNATLTKINADEALKLDGVIKIFTAKDIPKAGKNDFIGGSDANSPEELFCSQKVEFAGQAVGLIVADEEETAERAAAMVTLEYKDKKKPIISIRDAIKENSFFNPEEAKRAESASLPTENQDIHVIRGEIEFGGQFHHFMEPHVCLSFPTDDGLEINASAQGVTNVQSAISHLLGLEKNKIKVKVNRVGGGFGGKISRNLQPACATALAAYTLNRPVKITVPMDVTMKMLGKRLPYLCKYSANVSKDGLLKGVYISFYDDCGHVKNVSTGFTAASSAENVYKCPYWLLLPLSVKTNLPTNTYCRCPGSPQGIITIETIMEHIAFVTGKDPLEIRQKNWSNQSPKGELKVNYIDRIINILVKNSDFKNRKRMVNEFNGVNRWKKKGISVTPLKYTLKYFLMEYNIQISIYAGDGSICVSHGGVEMGQGINTKVSQVCSYELGAPLNKIIVTGLDSQVSPNNNSSVGSLTSDLCCFAAIECCKILKERMKPVTSVKKHADWISIVNECYRRSIDLCARNTYSKENLPLYYNIYAACVSEVEIDVLTGQTQVLRADILYDCGESMSPQIDLGQIEGGFIHGLGFILTEKLRYDPVTGENATPTTWSYFVPMSKDIPIDFRISTLEKEYNPFGVLGSKATSEPSVALASSIVLAIRNAITSARTDAGNKEWFTLNVPLTPEEILEKCLVNASQLQF